MQKAARVLLYIFSGLFAAVMAVSAILVMIGAGGNVYLRPADGLFASLPLLGICVTSLVINHRTAGKAKENK